MRLKNIIFIWCILSTVSTFGQKQTGGSGKSIIKGELITPTEQILKNEQEIQNRSTSKKLMIGENKIINGDARLDQYLSILKGKCVALVANQSSEVNSVCLVDTFISLGIKVKKVFSPEHGFRGNADAGEHIKNAKDLKTGLPIISLYGKNYKPKPADLKDIDIIVFDLQDVGARFYTYISTLYYTMQAAAENNLEYLVLDRPNPNGFYIDGPILQDTCKSYVGILPIPIVHGCTVGELAQMILGEGWLKTNKKLNLQIIPVENYTHETIVELKVKPSPNLPNLESILLYPSICLFEGTVISVGRGTEHPFQMYGHPKFPKTDFSFKPVSMPGASKNPPYQNEVCNGFFVKDDAALILKNKQINWEYLINAYKLYPEKESFFNSYFKNLAGNLMIRKLIESEASADEIRNSYEGELFEYREKRKQYLLYP